VIWLPAMSYTSKPPVLVLRMIMSDSPGMLLKLLTAMVCQSNPTVPMKAALVSWLLAMS